jgi:hypothetical protein
MANQTVDELKKKTDAAWANLARQLAGMEPHLDRSDAAGEWTTRQVLAHLLFEPGWKPEDTLRTFTDKNLPVLDLKPGETVVNAERQKMSLRQFTDALDAQRRGAYRYLETVPEADLGQRKIRIPLFKQFMGTDEISLAMFMGAMYDYHWHDHAGQLAKIRKAAGLADPQ